MQPMGLANGKSTGNDGAVVMAAPKQAAACSLQELGGVLLASTPFHWQN